MRLLNITSALIHSALILTLMAGLVACGGDESSSPAAPATSNGTTGTVDTGDGCPDGMDGCACIAGSACVTGLVCLDGACQAPECAVGSDGCACYSNNTCDGELDCVSGVCQADDCPEGSQGCACTAGGSCDGQLECSNNICDVAGCDPGSAGCACLAGDACSDGLVCQQNVCTASSCITGSDGCACGPGGSCDAGLICNGSDVCEAIDCTPGAVGCTCMDGACTGADAYCDGNGRCQEIDCPESEEGCACNANGWCSVDPEGNPLACTGGRCQSTRCAPGTPGCACLDGYNCGAGSTCLQGICRPDGCTVGSEHCPCSFGQCEVGLTCLVQSDICVDSTGHPGGLCLDNNSCYRGARCGTNGRCTTCLLGTLGCGCDDNNSCPAPGIACQGSVCVAQDDLVRDVPENPICHTQCSNDVTLTMDGVEQFVTCEGGFFEGCLEGRSCVDGQCLLPGQEPMACSSALECPSFQTCIAGQCYSDCKTNVDCGEGLGCYNFVCRSPCSSSESGACPQGMTCETPDGSNGYCMETGSSSIGNPTPRGTFDITATAVSMTNVSTVGSFQIINNSPVSQRFQLRKMGHEITYNDGSIETAVRRRSGLIDPAVCDALGDDFPCFCTDDSHCVDFDGERDERFQCQLGSCRPFDCPSGGCPLDWLSINAIAEDPARGQQLEVTVAAGEAKTIELSTPSRNENVARWSGELMVTNPTLGERRISVSYIALPEGQWMGQMVYLAQFGTKDLEPWLANKADSNLLEQVGNALIQRWGAFRGSDIRISWDEFVAVLTATQSGSWNYANVKEACRAQGLTGACYLYELGGVAQYTTDLEDFPIPSGPAVLPMTMNLRVDQNDASRLVGLIAFAGVGAQIQAHLG
ncbi:MAG: hypothetical protein AAFX99_05605 [Myxococcota bacterium]